MELRYLCSRLYLALEWRGTWKDAELNYWGSQEAFVQDWMKVLDNLDRIEDTYLYYCARQKGCMVQEMFVMLEILGIPERLKEPLSRLHQRLEGDSSTEMETEQIDDSNGQFYSGEVDPQPNLVNNLNRTTELTDSGATQANNPLKMLSKTLKGKICHPKKENFRMELIRLTKKIIRQKRDGIEIGTGIHIINIRKAEQATLGALDDYYSEHKPTLDAICDTEVGPATDGKQKLGDRSKDQRSYNNAYCRSFFSNEDVRTFYQIVIDLVFTGFQPGELCNRMRKFKCCGKLTHSRKCGKVWKAIYQYAKQGMLEEVGISDLRQEARIQI